MSLLLTPAFWGCRPGQTVTIVQVMEFLPPTQETLVEFWLLALAVVVLNIWGLNHEMGVLSLSVSLCMCACVCFCLSKIFF